MRFFVNRKTCDPLVIGINDDAATAVFGSNYSMPTTADWQELGNECYWVWTSDYSGHGVAGYIVYKAKQDSDKGKRVGSGNTPSASYSLTDSHIFLPAAGYRYYSGLYDDGSYGYYWSSSLYTYGSLYARRCDFGSSFVSTGNIGLRFFGQSVRLVMHNK